MADKPRVYVETTVISYLTAWPSAELITAAHQQITKAWWQSRQDDFELFASELVIREVQAGDVEAANRRLEITNDLRLLTINEAATQLAEILTEDLHLPDRASADAVHIALSVVHGMDYLISWNCRHIVNASHRQAIDRICESFGYGTPTICTPEELMEDDT